MKRLLQGPFTAITLGGLLFLLTMAVLLKSELAARPAAEPETENTASAFWERNNPEIDQLVQELKKEKAELAKRGALLNELETRLTSERAEMNQITQRVHQIQVEFDQNVVRVKEEETGNLKKLARMYASMTPEGAAAILNEMEDDAIVRIFIFMKEGESAPLLEAVSKLGDSQAKRAAAITEQLRKSIAHKTKPKGT